MGKLLKFHLALIISDAYIELVFSTYYVLGGSLKWVEKEVLSCSLRWC